MPCPCQRIRVTPSCTSKLPDCLGRRQGPPNDSPTGRLSPLTAQCLMCRLRSPKLCHTDMTFHARTFHFARLCILFLSWLSRRRPDAKKALHALQMQMRTFEHRHMRTKTCMLVCRDTCLHACAYPSVCPSVHACMQRERERDRQNVSCIFPIVRPL